jgi:hypothetical protein
LGGQQFVRVEHTSTSTTVGGLSLEMCVNIQKGDTTMTNENREMTAEEIENWLAIRKEAGAHIDSETAEVEWTYSLTLDPYGIFPELPEEYQQVGREYFARSPGSDVWVEFGGLPAATRDALWRKLGWRADDGELAAPPF